MESEHRGVWPYGVSCIMYKPGDTTSSGRQPNLLRDFAWHVGQRPDHVAVIDEGGAYTYAEVWKEASVLARWLSKEVGVVGHIINVTGPTNCSFVAAICGTLMAGGGVFLTTHPSASPRGLDASLSPILTLSTHDARVAAHGPPTYHVAEIARGVDFDPYHEYLTVAHDRENLPAYLVASSGSTGARKVIVGNFLGLSAFLSWERDAFAVGENDRVASLTDVSFDVIYRDLLLALVSGGTLVTPPTPAPRGSSTLEWLADVRATVVHAVPSIASSWTHGRASNQRVETLRAVLLAGEPLYDSVVRAIRNVLPRRCRVVNLYGPAETTLAKFSFDVPDPPLPGVQPVGHPLPLTAVHIVGRPDGRPLDVGRVGEVVLETPHGCLGYAGRLPEEIAARLKRDRGVTRFVTGDLGRLQRDGSLAILGRVDDQVKVHGVWVNVHDVAMAAMSVAGVREAAVVTVPSPKGMDLCGFVSPVTPELPIDLPAVRRAIKAACGSAAVPRQLFSVTTMPRLKTGKVDRMALRRYRSDPLPKEWAMNEPADRERISHLVSGVAEQVLGTEVSSTKTDLFDLGLDSLLAAELCLTIEESLRVPCSIDDIFESPTIDALAATLADRLRQARGSAS